MRRGMLLGTETREPRLMPTVQRAAESSLAAPQPCLTGMMGGLPSATGIPVTPLTALQSSAVWACIKCLSEDIAKLPLRVMRRLPGGGTVEAPSHPLNRLLRFPNSWQTAFDFRSYIGTALALRGNAYAVIVRGLDGSPIRLIPVSPDRVSVMLSPKGELYYGVFHQALGDAIVLHQDDMLHFRGLSLDGYIGLSPIAVAQEAIGLSLATQTHGAVLFRQGAQVPYFLKHPGQLSPEAAQRIAASFRDVHGGVHNAHKTAVLEEGMTLEKVGMTNEDAQFLATRGFQVLEICRIWRVPPHKVMELARATFTNIENQNQQYIDDALLPMAIRLEQPCERNLLFDDEQDEFSLDFDFEQLLRGDHKSRMESYQIGLQNGIYCVNEVRRKEGLPPVPGGDVYRFPLNMAPGAGAGAAADPASLPSPADVPPPAREPVEEPAE